MKVKNYVYTFFVDADSPLFKLRTLAEKENLTSDVQSVLEFYAGNGYVTSNFRDEEYDDDDELEPYDGLGVA